MEPSMFGRIFPNLSMKTNWSIIGMLAIVPILV